MVIVVTVLGFILGCLAYVYRYRGQVRYSSLTEYFAKGWPIFAPLNCLLYLNTRARGSRPILDSREFPELDVLRENWEILREEAEALYRQNYFDAARRPGTPTYYDVGFRTFFKYGWSRFYLRWYGYTHESARKLCPKTVALLEKMPSVNGAMFALLPVGAQLTRHADPMACSLRYHLGLMTPNSEKCFINIDGRNMHWKDGEVLMFDETYLHYARNDSSQPRLILMCDIDRPTNILGTVINFLYKGLPRLSVVPNTEVDRRGFANRVFSSISPLLERSKDLKRRNRRAYQALKYSVNTVLGLVLLGLIVGVITLLARITPLT